MYRIYETLDGKHIVLGGSELKFAKNLLEHLGRLDLLDRLREPPGPEQLPVIEHFERVFKAKTQAQWVDELGGLDICFAPVNNLRTGLDLPQTRHRRMVVEDPEGREHLGIPVKYSREPGAIDYAAPELGAHTDAVLEAAGVDPATLAEWRAEGVI